MALSEAEADRRTDLRNDVRRLRGRAARYERLSNEYKVMQASAEMELAAVETELRRLDKMR